MMADVGTFFRSLSHCFIGVFLLAWALEATASADEKLANLHDQVEADAPSTGKNLGTTITWYKDTKDAAKLAREQDKLVFLIQVSGNFSKEEFT